MWQFFSVRSFYYGAAIQSSAINVSPLSIVKMRETSRLFILISAYEGGVGHVYSQSRGRGQRKIFWGGAPDPDFLCSPNKNSWRRHWNSSVSGALISKFMPFTVHLTGIAKGVTQKRFLRPSTVGPHYSLSPGARPVSRRPWQRLFLGSAIQPAPIEPRTIPLV